MIFHQHIKDEVLDRIYPIHLGKTDPALRPVVYRRLMGDYTLWAVFHRKDWSTLPWPLSCFDEHDYDLEGVLQGPDFTASVFHREIRVVGHKSDVCWIEAGGHGIVLEEPKWYKAHTRPTSYFDKKVMVHREFRPGTGNNIYTYQNYKIENMDYPETFKLLKSVQKKFNEHGVSAPWEWADGLMWHNPEKVLERYGR